ncbi:hypothetical protein EV14_0209 [Prochlorococcus sp. MIT 0703]|nr:hypothetical protein EV12_0356 [Prochlorococcus sp. MIT 0701]KGG36653.1 hypothetical protein EV14_0209 [Prochlorococcus sp. MIT 0703]
MQHLQSGKMEKRIPVNYLLVKMGISSRSPQTEDENQSKHQMQ